MLSFDQAADRLEKRLRRYKRRLRDHKRTVRPRPDADGSAYVLAAPPDEDEIGEDYAPAIIAETRLDIPTISVSTAVMQLDRTDAPVVIFRNPSHGGVNVVYRRADGHFGWVDPALADAPPARRNQPLTRGRGSAPDIKVFSMDLSDLLKPEAVLPSLHAQSKKQVLQEVCETAGRLTGLGEREIFDTILQRERLGSTGVGHGVAIPHGKLRSLDRLVGVFARLSRPVDFDALDDQPVDLVFLLLAPESAGADHLKALARIARVLRDGGGRAEAAHCRRRRRALPGAGQPRAGLARRRSGRVTRAEGPRQPSHAQWTLTVSRSCSCALAIAAAFESVSMIGCPSAESSAHSFSPGASSRRLREQRMHVLGAHRPEIGDLAAAEPRESVLRHGLDGVVARHFALHPGQSRDVIGTFRIVRSGSGRTRSIDRSPSFRSAPVTSMPSASTKVRWNCRAAIPRWRYSRAPSSLCRPLTVSSFSSTVTSMSSRPKPATASVILSRAGRSPPAAIRSIL